MASRCNTALKTSALVVCLGALPVAPAFAQDAPPPKPGLPAIQRPFDQVRVTARFPISKSADWVAVTPDAVWVGGAKPNVVHRIDPRTNKDTLTVPLPGEPCAGLAVGFGSLWVPMCGPHQSVTRIDLQSGAILATIPMGPAEEGGIAASKNEVWFTTGNTGTLVRFDPRTNTVRQSIEIAAGSYNPIVDKDTVWITSIERGLITAVDARTGAVKGTAVTGPRPRFLAAGGGAIWTLNQGDGTITRIDAASHRSIATIQLGVPGTGGDIAYGAGTVWATILGMPLTAIDPKTNIPVVQWTGPGGDSLRIGHGSIWLTDYRGGTLSRIDPGDARPAPAKSRR